MALGLLTILLTDKRSCHPLSASWAFKEEKKKRKKNSLIDENLPKISRIWLSLSLIGFVKIEFMLFHGDG